MSLSFGTGANNAKNWFHDERTVNATTADNLDLAGGLTNAFGETLTFTQLKWVLIDIDSPDGSKALRVGPRAVANAMVAPFGDASDYITVTHTFLFWNPASGGLTVTAGTGDLLCIYNPGGSSVTYRIFLGGMV